jgi:hypothetical protein
MTQTSPADWHGAGLMAIRTARIASGGVEPSHISKDAVLRPLATIQRCLPKLIALDFILTLEFDNLRVIEIHWTILALM